MTRILILFTLFCSCLTAAQYDIPSARRINWVPGTDVGVPGGVEQYLNGSGEANERPTSGGINAVTDYSADNTGVTDTGTAIRNAINAATTGQVVYFPAGVYKSSVSIAATSVTKSNFTIRGAGSPVRSTSSVTIGTGEKTFTVMANGPWTAGIGVFIWNADPDDYENAQDWMYGTITSYSGTTLVVDVDEVGGSGTHSLWKVSRTHFWMQDSAGKGFVAGDGAQFPWSSATTTVSGSPSKGDTSFTVASASGLAIDDVLMIWIGNMEDAAEMALGEMPVISTVGYRNVRRQMVKITNVSGTTITFTPALAFDLPSARSPAILEINVTRGVGAESFSLGGQSRTGSWGPLLEFTQAYGCWIYDVDADVTPGYGAQLNVALHCTIQKSYIGLRRSGGSNGGGIVLGNYAAHNLIIDNIAAYNYPGIEINEGVTGNAFLYNLVYGEKPGDVSLILIHNAHPSFQLHEGNVYYFFKADGYFGSASEDTFFRNWIRGGTTLGLDGAVAFNRMYRNGNIVGNVLGEPNVADGYVGSLAYGYPNISNIGYTGTAEPSTGDPWLDLGLTGTLTTRTSDTEAVFTLNSIGQITSASAGELYPSPGQSTRVSVWWNSYGTSRLYSTASAVDSGAGTITLVTGEAGTGSNFPITSTSVAVWAGMPGFQELDLDVQNTVIDNKGNYIVSGSGGSQQSLGGDTLADSLAYAAKPTAIFGTLSWPPFDPASPTFSIERLPAGYRLVNGTDDYLNEAVGTATITGTLTVTGTITLE